MGSNLNKWDLEKMQQYCDENAKGYVVLEEKRIDVSNVVDKPKGSNILCIKEGYVYMEYADCPDQICVKHKAISKNGEMIICLPNEVFVRVENATENKIDN